MTKTKIAAIALAAIMVVGTLGFNPAVFAANPNANEASPANGGISNGLPFTNLQAQIDEINAELEALGDVTDDLQDELDALRADVDANADDIAVLEEILGTNCGSGAIRAILANGTVLCISINEPESVVMSRVFGPFVNTSSNQIVLATATCPSFLGRASGGGFDQVVDINGIHDGAVILESFASSTSSWSVQAQEQEFGGSLHAHDVVRAVVSCLRVL